MSDWVDVVEADRLKLGERVKLDLDDVEVIVCRAGEAVYAFEDLCSHDSYPLGDGPIEDGAITCPLHGASFCLRSGEALTPPAYSPITVFPVRIENGMVQVRDDRWD